MGGIGETIIQDEAPKIAKFRYKWLTYGCW